MLRSESCLVSLQVDPLSSACEFICNEPGRASKDRAMPGKMESKDGAALEFGDDQFNEASSVFRPCFDSRKKATV